jgi:putative membrane protein
MFIIKWILKWLVLSAAVFLAAYIVPGILVSSWTVALVAGLVLGLINMFVKPVLSILTIPINLITLGLFGIILNGLLFWAVEYFVAGFDVTSLVAAILGSIIVAIVMWFAHLFLD